jgi:aryl-alcohol dehydrogenase-like predicted oxidoreductase
MSVSVIGLGTWQFGSTEWGYGTDYADHEARRIVERALEVGINFFDTAEIYGFGASERILGQALSPVREGVIVATKYAPFFPLPGIGRKHARDSLARLSVGWLDLYQIHFPNPLFPLKMQIKEFEPLIHSGEIGAIGISNASVYAWQEMEGAVDFPVVSNQVHFSLFHRKAMRETIPYANATGRLVIAYSPLEQGLLTGKYSIDKKPLDFRRFRRSFSNSSFLRLEPLLRVMQKIGKGYGADPAQIALAWVISFPNVVAIVGASSVEQLERNAMAADIELDQEDVLDLTAAAERYLG